MASESTFMPIGSQIVTRKGLERVADIDPRLTRSNYFDNRLLTAEDLNRDQIYLDGRLREVGEALGHGILQGLEVTLDTLDGTLLVQPGMAVSRAGRVLELTRSLRIDLADRAKISELNAGGHRRFNRGLYAVLLNYAEVGTDIAEVFPTDLGEKRDFQYDVISEGVQLGLVPLQHPLAQQNPLNLRAALIREFLGDNSAGGVVPEDAVALGVLAISSDRPQWLDAQLLRQPLRTLSQPGDLQRDLYRHYQLLFDDVLAERNAGSLGGDFAAVDYFQVLPPAGSLPKQSIDPVTGRQGYFPENFNVWAAPLRLSDLQLVREEAMLLQPIDLSLQDPVDIVVLAALSNASYGRYAQRLERPVDQQARRLPVMDLLRLRLRPQRPVHMLDTDAATWQAIWNEVREQDLLYIRRPLRAAETGISGIVLAQGIDLPATAEEEMPLPSPADAGLLQDEDSVLLNRVNFSRLAELRSPTTPDGENALADLETEFGGDALVVLQCMDVQLRIERSYDALLWQTLLSLARAEQLPAFLVQLTAGQGEAATGAVIADIGAAFGLDAGLIAAWSASTPD